MNRDEIIAMLKVKGISPTDLVQYVNDPDPLGPWSHVPLGAVIVLFTILKEMEK